MFEEFFTPSYFNEFVTKAYTTTVDNSSYAQTLIDLQNMENSQDLFIETLNHEDLSDETLLFIITSLYKIFNQNKSVIPCYSQFFTEFFVNKFSTFDLPPYLIDQASKLFVLIFRGNRENAKMILDSIKNKQIVCMFSAVYAASSKSMNGFTIYFENVLKSFQIQTEQSGNNYLLFAKMLSQFNSMTVKPELIQLIMENGGPKVLLNAVDVLNEDDVSFFLKSLHPIINLPVTIHKTEPNRITYLIQFVEAIIELLQVQHHDHVISDLSFLINDLCECPSIRSFKEPDFLVNVLKVIDDVSINSLTPEILNDFPYSIENWMHFWSMTFDFALFKEDSDFHQFVLDIIKHLFDCILPFLTENSSLIYEKLIVGDDSSKFFEYVCHLCSYNYINISNQICTSYQTDQIEELIWHTEFAINLMNSHKFDVEQQKYLSSDFDLLTSIIKISEKIPHNSNFVFEISLASLLTSFFNLYWKRNDTNTEQIEPLIKENSSVFIIYFLRILNTLSLKDLNIQSIRILIEPFNSKKYRSELFKAAMEIPEFFTKFAEISFPFIYEKDKMCESEKLYTFLFSVIFEYEQNIEPRKFFAYTLSFNVSNNKFVKQLLNSCLENMKELQNVPFILNILSTAFKPKTNDELCLSFYFEALLPMFSSVIESGNQFLFKHIAKFILNVVTSYEDRQPIFKIMTPKILFFFKSTIDILLKMVKNSEFNEHLHHFCIESICSLIKNRSLNIGVLSFYGDNSFQDFIYEYFMVISKQDLTPKFFTDLINLIQHIVQYFDMNEAPFSDLFKFFLTEIVIKEIGNYQLKDIMNTINIFNETLDCCNIFDLDMINILLICFMKVLPLFKNISPEVTVFYLKLFYITKDQNILELAPKYLQEDEFEFVQTIYSQLLEADAFNASPQKLGQNYQEMMQIIKKIVILNFKESHE